ncbi:hypothetical protein EVAR_70553_1 [Eumeta japonica]|uniref:Uncharacterized protein n=1 Tax=Eumeta variegata TaxID=151549 RepID=A0A4C2AAQ3_EUMVA|nr:hypothetical protein EVAR_70553_1 [Eumeta japonica]
MRELILGGQPNEKDRPDILFTLRGFQLEHPLFPGPGVVYGVRVEHYLSAPLMRHAKYHPRELDRDLLSLG